MEISFKILLSRFIMTIHRLPKDLTPTQLLVGHNRLGLDSDLEDTRSSKTIKIRNSIITMFTLNYSSSSSRLHRK